MLLYCARDYPGFDQEAPGVGIVTKIELGEVEEVIYYQYFPFDSPVDWYTLKSTIKELKNCDNFSLIGNWLRKIDRNSFSKAIQGHQIDWP